MELMGAKVNVYRSQMNSKGQWPPQASTLSRASWERRGNFSSRETDLSLLDYIKGRIQAESNSIFHPSLSSEQRLNQLRDKVIEIICEEGLLLPAPDLQDLVKRLVEEVMGLGPLEPLLKDEDITEIMINGPDQVFVEKEGRLHLLPLKLNDAEHVYYLIERIIGPLGLRVDESSPFVDARLPDGSRVNVIIPPLSLKGPAITIRKFSAKPLTLESLVNRGTLSPEVSSFLRKAVEHRLNIIISGGAGSGKTTLLNALSAFIPAGERIITIEDAAELRLQQSHVLPLEARPPNLEGKGEITIRDLLRNALRMRPDRIIIGEVRGGEALDMLQAMNTGHEGSLSTVHANSPVECLYRLETMALMANTGLPASSISAQIKSSVDLIIHVARTPAGNRRVVEVSEIDSRGAPSQYLLNRIFYLDTKGEAKECHYVQGMGDRHLLRICSKRSFVEGDLTGRAR